MMKISKYKTEHMINQSQVSWRLDHQLYAQTITTTGHPLTTVWMYPEDMLWIENIITMLGSDVALILCGLLSLETGRFRMITWDKCITVTYTFLSLFSAFLTSVGCPYKNLEFKI